MPIRIKCIKCHKALELDDAFAGARCRCKFCKALQDVRATGPSRAAAVGHRPVHPPLASKSPHKPIPHKVERKTRTGLAKRRGFLIGGSALAALLAIGIVMWTQSTPTPPSFQLAQDDATEETGSIEVTSTVKDGARKGNLSKFLNVPVAGQFVAVVVDADSDMRERIDGVAILTEAFAIQMQAKGRNVGVAMATESNPVIVETMPTIELTTSSLRSTIFGRFARGQTDLVAAASAGASWRPDELFLVFGRRLDTAEIEALLQKIQQSGAHTHIIALGDARDQDLSALLAGVHGEIHHLSDEQLFGLAKLTRAAAITEGQQGQ